MLYNDNVVKKTEVFYEKFIHPSRGGALGSKSSEDADLGLKNFTDASKTRHLKSALNAEDTPPCHCEECVSTTS
ncbi:hypothetical protein IJ732_00615, partial [bacterium]|nr:hypothetical protein [bacterium]